MKNMSGLHSAMHTLCASVSELWGEIGRGRGGEQQQVVSIETVASIIGMFEQK